MSKNRKYLIYIFAILSLLSFAMLSCSKGSSSVTDPYGETRLLKITVKENIDSRAEVSVNLNGAIFEKGELAKGISVPVNKILTIIVKTSIPDATIFWSGRRIADEERRKKEISILMDKDAYLVLTVGEDNKLIEMKKLSLFVGDNGKLIVDDEDYQGYNVITLADSQVVTLRALPAKDYYFGGWYGDAEFSYKKDLSITMNDNKDVSVSFVDDISVGIVISPIENGIVKINGATYDKTKEYRFQIGETITLDAIATNTNYKFLGWSGSVSASQERLQFPVDTDMKISPIFGEPNGVAILTIDPVGVAGFGNNKVKYTIEREGTTTTAEFMLSKQNNIIYYDGTSAPLQKGDKIKFEALPGEGYVKSGDGVKWSGGINAEGLTQTFEMLEESKVISVNFALISTELRVKVIRQYVGKDGSTIITEVNNTSDPTYVPKSSTPLPSESWGFSIKIGTTTLPQFMNSSAFERVFNKDNAPEAKYGDIINVSAIAGDYYTFNKMVIDGVDKTGATEKFAITSDTVVEIYLKRKEITVPLKIVNGYYNNTTTSRTLQSKINVTGSGFGNEDILATNDTSDHSVKVLSGQNVTLAATGTSAASFQNFTRGATSTPGTIENIKTAPATTTANFVTNKVNLTINDERYYIDGSSTNRIPDVNKVAEILGFSIKDGTTILGIDDANIIKSYDYGTKLDILGVVSNVDNFDSIDITGGSNDYMEGAKTLTAKLYHKVVSFNLGIIRNGGSGRAFVHVANTGISDEDYTSTKLVKVIAGKNATLEAHIGSDNDYIFKGYAKGLTGKRLTVYKPGSVGNSLNAQFVYAKPWDGSSKQSVSGNPIEIYNPDQLAWLGTQSAAFFRDKTVYIKEDINMGNGSGFKGINSGLKTVGANNITNLTFDGQGHEVANLNIDTSGTTEVASGLIGIAVDSTIKNISTSGKVTGWNTVGGIVGVVYHGTTISNCYNKADVTATTTGIYGRAGGVVSYMYKSELYNCYNSGNVIAHGGEAGGLVALSHVGGIIKDSYNIGYVEADRNAGGVVGGVQDSPTSTIERVYNVGTVKALSFGAGGIVGELYKNSMTSISYVYNIGSVISPSKVGAIVGNNEGASSISIAGAYYVNTGIAPLGYVGVTGTYEETAEKFESLHSILGVKWRQFDSLFNVVNGVSKRPVLIGVGEGE